MTRAAVLALVACGSRAPHERPPADQPREVWSAYHLGGLRIEGAPPLDAAIGKAFDAQPSIDPARLFDLLGSSVMVGARGHCMTFDVEGDRIRDLARSCANGASWGSFRLLDPEAYLVDDEAEQSQLFLGRERIDIPAGRITDPVWSPNRDTLLFGLARTGPAELWAWDRKTGARLIAPNGPWAPLDVSPDGTVALARNELSTKRSVLYQIELATGATRRLSNPNAATPLARFAPDGDVFAVTDDGTEYRHVERFPGPRSTYRGPRASHLPGDVIALAMLPSGVPVVVLSSIGRTTLWTIGESEPRQIEHAPIGGVIADLRTADNRIAFTFGTPTQPREVWIGDLARNGDYWSFTRQVRWPGDPPPRGVEIYKYAVTATDDISSELYVYRPPGNARVPVVVEFHSGPEDRWHPTYDSFAQFLASRGYAVVRPNLRGSAGQGRSFEAADDGVRRPEVMRDVRAMLDWIAAQSDLDASHVAVAGTSYGGYLALAAQLAFPDRIRGAAVLSPITDFVGFLEGTAPYRQDHRRAEYGDERDPAIRDALTTLSPLSHVAEIKRPLLIAYGQRDPRVPPATTERFVRAARAAGASVWSIAAADEGHWFELPENRRAFEVLAVQFLDSLRR